MTPIEIITSTVGISLLIALYYHKKDWDDDFEFLCTFGEHLYDPKKLEERGKILFWVSIGNFVLALLNLFYMFFK